MDIRRSKRTLLSLIDPLPPVPIRKPRRAYPNTIVEALKIKAFINSGATRITWAKTRKELNISESKLAHMLKIVNTLPPDFIESMKQCDDPRKLKIFHGRRLLYISRLKTEKERCARIQCLMQNYKMLPPATSTPRNAPFAPLVPLKPDCQPVTPSAMFMLRERLVHDL